MTQKPLKDVAASVRQRLLNRSGERHEDFQLRYDQKVWK